MEAMAYQKYIRVSPKKLTRLAEPLKGKNVLEAESMLKISPSTSSKWLWRAIHSAAANLRVKLGPDAPDSKEMFIATIEIHKGPVFRRLRPRAMGRADIIHRRTSHIKIRVSSEGD